MIKNEFSSVVQSVLDSEILQDHINNAQKLSSIYNQLLDYVPAQNNETLIRGGVALSSFAAADCIQDYFRTVYFIKGIYKALTRLIETHPGKKTNVLYAGTGPYATLILPLLPLFHHSDLAVLFLDINQYSIESVQFLAKKTGLQLYDLSYAVSDATTFTIPENFTVDLLVSETMHMALTQEPQVSIAKNLVPQLPEHAIMIPQDIHIDFGYSFFAKEPFVSTSDDIRKGYNKLQPYENRILIDRLFTVNKELFINNDTGEYRFVSKFYTLPVAFESHPDACIFTEITVFEDLKLNTAQSLITNPYCLVSLYTIQHNTAIQLIYDFSDIPNWTYTTA